jgi:hypothetical protein
MIGVVVKEAAKHMLTSFLGSYADDAKDAVIDAAKDKFESVITGRRTIEAWAEIAAKCVDKIKDRAVSEENLNFVGGKLKFAFAPKNPGKVVISFELYFRDEGGQWQKIAADSDMYASNFTFEALDEIKEKTEVVFEVE